MTFDPHNFWHDSDAQTESELTIAGARDRKTYPHDHHPWTQVATGTRLGSKRLYELAKAMGRRL